MLQNAYLLAKIGADTAENERKFADILPKLGNYPTGPTTVGRPARARERERRIEKLLELDTMEIDRTFRRCRYVHIQEGSAQV